MQSILFPESTAKPIYGFTLPNERLAYQNLYSFLKKEKGLCERDAEKYAKMLLLKRVHHYLKYDSKDENILSSLIHSARA